MSDVVFVELHPVSRAPIRIFKSWKVAMHLVSTGEASCAREMDRALAVGLIRHQCFVRSKSDCEWCGVALTEKTGHMHEAKNRGEFGEISVANSVFICYECHFNSRIAGTHKKRNPRFTRRQS